MKHFFAFIAFLCIITFAKAQSSSTDKVHTIVEEMPEFPGGVDSLMSYLSKNTKYPNIAKDCNCTGTVYVTFVIDTAGKVINPYILRGAPKCGRTFCYDKKGKQIDCDGKKKVADKKHICDVSKYLDKEAYRVVSSIPDWSPGKQDGVPVMVQYNIPIKFSLR
jgi:protein TonB